jgi:hypothetical protein
MPGCRVSVWASAAVLLLTAEMSFAHGGPASVEVVSFNPLAPQRMAVGTSYGLASTHDAGVTWSLTCEGAIGETGSTHPRIAVTSEGALVAGLFSGAVLSDSAGCAYSTVGDLSGYVTLDVQNVPGDSQALIALTRQSESYHVWRSEDDGSSWSIVGSDFGPKFQAYSVGATSDPNRFYVGGVAAAGGLASMMITNDGGQSFSAVLVPDADAAPNDPLFVEAVDPLDPDTLIAAIYEPPSKVLLSTDGGASWTELFEGWTVLTGLAVSPDFDTIVTGSPAMGLWRVALPAGSPEQVSDLPVRCLTWTDDALLICTDDAVTGYAVGRSTDVGVTVEPLLELRCLQRPSCGPDTQVEHECASEWPSLVQAVGIEVCDPQIGTSSASGTGGQDGGGGMGAGGSGGNAIRYTPVGGCVGCATARRGRTLTDLGSWGALIGLAALIGRRRRHR